MALHCGLSHCQRRVVCLPPAAPLPPAAMGSVRAGEWSAARHDFGLLLHLSYAMWIAASSHAVQHLGHLKCPVHPDPNLPTPSRLPLQWEISAALQHFQLQILHWASV
jgi:hypothetical protein